MQSARHRLDEPASRSEETDMRTDRLTDRSADADPVEMPGRVAPDARRARLIRIYATTAAAIVESRTTAPRLLGVIVLSLLCAAAIVIGWGLVLASLLYVIAEYSTTTWLLTALGVALGHGVLAAACWRYAVAIGGELTAPRRR
jgi:hypothetical protein